MTPLFSLMFLASALISAGLFIYSVVARAPYFIEAAVFFFFASTFMGMSIMSDYLQQQTQALTNLVDGLSQIMAPQQNSPIFRAVSPEQMEEIAKAMPDDHPLKTMFGALNSKENLPPSRLSIEQLHDQLRIAEEAQDFEKAIELKKEIDSRSK